MDICALTILLRPSLFDVMRKKVSLMIFCFDSMAFLLWRRAGIGLGLMW